MNWAKKDSKRPSMISYILTIVMFLLSVAIAVVTTPFVQFYYYTGVLPDSETSHDIIQNVGDNIGGILLSCVVGFVILLITMAIFRFGKFISAFFTMIEFYALYLAAELFASWLLWKYNDSVDSTLLTMIPFIIMQLSVFVVLELGAILGQGGRVGFGFVALSASLGAFAGALRTIEQEYFSYSIVGDPFWYDANLGIAFGESVIDTVFLAGSCALCGVCIVRSKCGGSGFWHIVALILPTGLASAFSMYVQLSGYIPEIESDVARYILGSVIALITLLLAIALFSAIRKMPEARTPPNNQQANGPATGPIAANAVVLV